ncbi:ESX-5 secretion system protein EccC5 [Phycisphaerales bacterium]|nr:ESX-5 secretion system protein EccC5 [Phycisphaerales bacterium]
MTSQPPTHDLHFLDQARLLSDRLTAIARESPAALASADESLQKAKYEAEREHDAAVSEAKERFVAQSQSLQRKAIVQRRDMEARLDAAISEARHNAESETASFERKTKDLADRAEHEIEEREWIAETMGETADHKAEHELATARTALEHKMREVSNLSATVATQLRRGGYPALAPAPPASAPTENFEQIRARALSLAEALRRRSKSYFGSLFLPLIAAVATSLAAASVLAALGQTSPAQFLRYAGAFGGGVLVLMLVTRFIFRRRVAPAVARLSATLGELSAASDALLRRFEQGYRDQMNANRAAKSREVNLARKLNAERREHIRERQKTLLPQLRERHAGLIAAADSQRESELKTFDAHFADAVAQLRETRRLATEHAQQQRDDAIARAEGVHASFRQSLRARWTTLSTDSARIASDLHSQAAAMCPPWADSRWPLFPPADQTPPAMSLGTIELQPASLLDTSALPPEIAQAIPAPIRLPVPLESATHPSLLLLHAPDQRAHALQTLNQVMLRLLTSIPPGKVRFTIIDPVGLGQSFAAFMHLADYEPLLVSDRIWTDARHIEQKLVDLTEHMENVIQKYLRNQYKSIQEYNADAGEVAEPFRFLVLADFPTNLTDPAAKRLASIIAAGARCGVHTLIAADARSKGAPHLPIADIEKHSLTIELQKGCSLKDPVLSRWPLTLESPPDNVLHTAILNRAGELAKDSSRVQVPFELVAPGPGQEWSLSSASELSVPIGRAGAHKLQRLTMGRGMAQHALIAGRTGAGKSTLFHVLVTNLALWYSPSEVEIYLIDFKKGVEFKTYATHRLPHARVIAVESEREFGLSVLRRLDAELTRRGMLFRDAGVQDVASYRDAARASGSRLPDEMPRIVLAVDEFQEFFVDDDKIAQEASLLLDRLVRQGRAFGMHLVLGSQTLGGAFSIARSTMGQMAIRIALQSSDQDSYLIMSEDNTAPRLLTRPGEAIYNDASGLIEGNSPFQIVWLDEDRRETILAGIQARAINLTTPDPIVFEGNVPADIRTNQQLARVLKDPVPQALPHAWLGEPISIKDPTFAAFPMRSGANLLTVGQDEAAAASIHALAMLALAAQTRPSDKPRILLINAFSGEGETGVLLDAAAAALGPAAARHGPRETPAVIASLLPEVERRLALPPGEADRLPPIFLFVYGLHRLRDLRRGDEFSFSSDASAPPDQFATILREGPGVGVHSLVWCDTVTALERAVNRQSLREFGSRIVFQMSASDSTHLIDSPAASNLGRNRALFYTDETAGLEKFRPYSPPSVAWIRHATNSLRNERTPKDANDT